MKVGGDFETTEFNAHSWAFPRSGIRPGVYAGLAERVQDAWSGPFTGLLDVSGDRPDAIGPSRREPRERGWTKTVYWGPGTRRERRAEYRLRRKGP